MKKLLFAIFLLFIYAAAGSADSIWNENSGSPYSPHKAYKAGDIINVLILESSTAKNEAGTKSDIKDDLSAKFTHTLQRLAPIIGANNQIVGQAANRYTGDGSTTRGNKVTARIAAWVTEVLPNGNLAIQGKHKVEVNDEIQEIAFEGIVRPKDISGANTLYSYQVANAELSVKGTGVVSDTSAPGWITRILNWLF